MKVLQNTNAVSETDRTSDGFYPLELDGYADDLARHLYVSRLGLSVESNQLFYKGLFGMNGDVGVLMVKMNNRYMPPTALKFGGVLLGIEELYKSAGKMIHSAGYLILPPGAVFGHPPSRVPGRDLFMLVGADANAPYATGVTISSGSEKQELPAGGSVLLNQYAPRKISNNSVDRAVLAFVKITEI